MNAVIFGAGIGAIILCVLWIIALVLCSVSLRTKYNLGPLAISIAIVVSAVLLSIPRDVETIQSVIQDKILDPLFVWRTTILLFLGVCAIGSVGFAITTELLDVKQGRPLKTWYLKT